VLGPEAMKPQIDICGRVSLAEISSEFMEELDLLEPFGHSNPEPVFLAKGVVTERRDLAGGSHTRGVLRDPSGGRLDFIAFSRLPTDFPDEPWNLVFTPQINTFGGRSTPQARILDVRHE